MAEKLCPHRIPLDRFCKRCEAVAKTGRPGTVVAADPGVGPLSADEARALTDEVKRDSKALWEKLQRLYEGGAHKALGYSSWGGYFEAEFGQSQARGYQLLAAGRVLEASRSTRVEPPRTEAQARALSPLLDRPDELREAWTEAKETANGEPTAGDVREAVQTRTGKKRPAPKRVVALTEDELELLISWAEEYGHDDLRTKLEAARGAPSL